MKNDSYTDYKHFSHLCDHEPCLDLLLQKGNPSDINLIIIRDDITRKYYLFFCKSIVTTSYANKTSQTKTGLKVQIQALLQHTTAAFVLLLLQIQQ